MAQDGMSAIEKAEYAHPDIILLDVLMPGIDGFETCRRLKALGSTKDIPVIFMTALSETVDKVRGFQLGAVDYITKPVQYEEVLARVTTHLTLRNLTKRLLEQNFRLQQEICDRKQAEEQLRELESQLREALAQEKELSELRNSFLTLVSHEFRTPLTTIQSSAELLSHYNEKLSQAKKQTHHQRIQAALTRMTQLLDEVLLIGQAEAGKLKFEPKLIDLVPWCRDLVEGMRVVVEKAHMGKNYQHAIAFTNTGECTNAQMDEKLLEHILTNLLSNAIKYSPKGGTVQFDLLCTDIEAVFRITDRGIGIPEEDQQHLFESFSRASNVGTIQGTGLGLAIVKKAVDLHRGTICIQSQVGVGTTVIVTLPLN